MEILDKQKVIEFLIDLTALTKKHGIIMGQDLSKIMPTPTSGLQIGFNINIQEYAAYQEMVLISIPKEADIIADAVIVEETKNEAETTEPVAEVKSTEEVAADSGDSEA